MAARRKKKVRKKRKPFTRVEVPRKPRKPRTQKINDEPSQAAAPVAPVPTGPPAPPPPTVAAAITSTDTGETLPATEEETLENPWAEPLKSAKREKFAQGIVAGMSPANAHKNAGYTVEKEKNRSRAAHELKRVTEVHLRILALQSQAAAEVVTQLTWSQSEIMAELRKNVEHARKGYPIISRDGTHSGEYRPDFASVNRALELYGKQLGMFKETLLVGSAEDRALDNMTDEEVQILQKAWEEIEQSRRLAGAKPVGAGPRSPAKGEAADLRALPETAGVSPEGS